MVSPLWRGAVLLLALGALEACSFVFNLDGEQCTMDHDCTLRGGEFAESVCTNGVCRSLTDQAECTTNAECKGPRLCSANKCVLLTSPECPIVAGEENLRTALPIVFGAYAPFNPLNASAATTVQNYELAIDEFTLQTGGLQGGPNGSRRPFAAVVCQSTTDTKTLDRGMDHLVNTVGVVGIVAALEPNLLRTAFETRGQQKGVFFMGLFFADSALSTLPDEGLVWNLMPDPLSLAPVYSPLLAQIEAHLNVAEPLRVATVEGTAKEYTDLGDAIAKQVSFNGQFQRLSLPPVEIDPTGANTVLQVLLQDLHPHLIISLAGEEFLTRILPQLENAKPQTQPFYVLSSADPFSATFPTYVAVHPEITKRCVGVNVASAEDKTLYEQYIGRFLKAHPAAVNYESIENFYDAPYYLMYAYAGAGNVGEYTGQDLVRGMKRLLKTDATLQSGTRFEVGPTDVSPALGVLSSTSASRIGLWGTTGPPVFEESSGTCQGEGSVWCICAADQSIVHDAMRYDEVNQALIGSNACCPL